MPIAVDGRDLLAIGGFDGTVRLWDPQTGEVRAVLEGHQSSVHGVCAITVDGRDLLASCSRDETLRVWDSETGACVLTVPTHHRAWGLAWVAGSLAVALDTGVLVIKPNLIA